MTSILLFLAGALVATIILMAVGQKRNREMSDRISTLTSDISAKQKEAEMLSLYCALLMSLTFSHRHK